MPTALRDRPGRCWLSRSSPTSSRSAPRPRPSAVSAPSPWALRRLRRASRIATPADARRRCRRRRQRAPSRARILPPAGWSRSQPIGSARPDRRYAQSPSRRRCRRTTDLGGATERHDRGRNHVWIPALGIDRSVSCYACSSSYYPGNRVYRWGCAGRNNVYLFGHAHSVFKPLHDAYVRGRLRKGMKVYYAESHGRVVDIRGVVVAAHDARQGRVGLCRPVAPEPDAADLRRGAEPVPPDRPARQVEGLS